VRIVRYLAGGHPVPRVGVELDDGIRRLATATMGELLGLPLAEIRAIAQDAATAAAAVRDAVLLPPVDGRTEIWAAGVTYHRSRQARMEESATADVYDLVYGSERPELFFKSAAWRVVTSGEPIGIRRDSALNVPEPELALIVNRHAEVVGYVVCDDVSSRSIEGENPLYLPQAKVYAGSCALSDGIRPAWEVQAADRLDVEVSVERGGQQVWSGATSTSQMRRTAAELVGYLFRAEQFPEGVVISTGTGLVPGMEFTLREGDLVTIRVQDVGELANPVVAGRQHFDWLAAPVRRR
jgi:2-dehydro-3-deoxy-D-arabinonate dehydratase